MTGTVDERLAAALHDSGWEMDTNVCGACFDHGSRHDLNDRCLDCSCQCFASMTRGELSTWHMGRLIRSLADSGVVLVEREASFKPALIGALSALKGIASDRTVNTIEAARAVAGAAADRAERALRESR